MTTEQQLYKLAECQKNFSKKMEEFRAYRRYPLRKVRNVIKIHSELSFFILSGQNKEQEIENLHNLIEDLCLD